MPLHFNTVLGQAGMAPSTVRLLRHKDGRSEKGRTPYKLWQDDRPAFEAYQESQSFENRSKLRAEYWASFVVTPAGETLLAGLYRSRYLGMNETERTWPHAEGRDPVGTCDIYELTLDQSLNDLAGRLIIDWGDGERAWIQRADNQDKIVLEVRKNRHELPFPGLMNFHSLLSGIENLPAKWIEVLRSSRGVYVMTCPKTREHYVGSATGEENFYGRWLDYGRNGHGGNTALKERDPSDFQVSILEVAGSTADGNDICKMEAVWKKKLQSRDMGLNRN